MRKAIELLSAVAALALAASAATVLPQAEQVAAYISLDGVSSVAYRGGGSDHIYLQTFTPTGSSGTGTGAWSAPLDLILGISPQPPLPLGPLFAMVFNPAGGTFGPAFNGIVYTGEDGDIHLLSSLKGSSVWTHTDLNVKVGVSNAPKAAGNPMAFVGTPGTYGGGSGISITLVQIQPARWWVLLPSPSREPPRALPD